MASGPPWSVTASAPPERARFLSSAPFLEDMAPEVLAALGAYAKQAGLGRQDTSAAGSLCILGGHADGETVDAWQ